MIKIINNGAFLENIIVIAIKKYNENEIAIFHKRNINNFFIKNNYSKKINDYSGCDFIGLYKNKYIVIEAKEVHTDIFNIKNISSIQKKELKLTDFLGGLSFILFYFQNKNSYYIIEYKYLINLGKNIKINEIKKIAFKIKLENNYYLDFLKGIDYFINHVN